MPKSSTLNLDSTTLLIIIIIVLVIMVVVFFFNKEKENFTDDPDCTSEQKVGEPCLEDEEGYTCRSQEPVEGGRSNIIWCYDKEFRGDA